jgi:hypothetical protein
VQVQADDPVFGRAGRFGISATRAFSVSLAPSIISPQIAVADKSATCSLSAVNYQADDPVFGRAGRFGISVRGATFHSGGAVKRPFSSHRSMLELGSLLPAPKDGIVTPISFHVKRRNLRGILGLWPRRPVWHLRPRRDLSQWRRRQASILESCGATTAVSRYCDARVFGESGAQYHLASNSRG